MWSIHHCNGKNIKIQPGKDGASTQKIYKLGSRSLKKVKRHGASPNRALKNSLDLIKIYAKRRLKKGFNNGPDWLILQNEIRGSFIYEKTPNRSKQGLRRYKRDMEKVKPPWIRLIVYRRCWFWKNCRLAMPCGTFKAVANGNRCCFSADDAY